MSISKFVTKEHILPTQHLREEFIITAPADPVYVQVKQYTPRNNPAPKEGDITILSSHANTFPRELYEPFWDDLLSSLTSKGLNIRNIFILTPANFSPEILNPNISDGTREPDTCRDLLLMVNHFRQTIVHPIVGVGHSIGASQLASLALMHPSLFTSIVLIDPIIGSQGADCGVERLALGAIKRQREWKTRSEAEAFFSRVWGNWDARIKERWNASALIPCDRTNPNGKTELSWGRLQELTTYIDLSELRASANRETELKSKGKGTAQWTPYVTQLWDMISLIGVHVFYVCGEKSEQHNEKMRKHWHENTATNKRFWMRGFRRKVDLLILEKLGHLAPFENPTRCADSISAWIARDMKDWWTAWEDNKQWQLMSKEHKDKAINEWMTGLKSRM